MIVASREAIRDAATAAYLADENITSNPYPVESHAHQEWRDAFVFAALDSMALDGRLA